MPRSNLAAILAAAILFGGTSLPFPLSDWDQASASYMGQVVLSGGTPYVDAWNVKAPGVYFVYALKLLLLGRSALGLRVFDLLWQLATALVLAYVARRLAAGSERPESAAMAGAITGVAYLAAYYSTNYWTWAEADGFLTLPLALGFAALLLAGERDDPKWWALAAAGIGVAAVFKLAFGFAGVGTLIAAAMTEPRLPGRVTLRCAALAAGLAAPLAACAAYLMAKGAWPAFLDTQFVLAPQFTAALRKSVTLDCIRLRAGAMALVPTYLLTAAALVFGARACLTKIRGARPAVVAAVWLAVAALTLVAHGAYLKYHFLPLAAPATLLAAGGVAAATHRAWRSGWLPRSIVLVLAGAFLFAPARASTRRIEGPWEQVTARIGSPDWDDVTQYIRNHSQNGDRIFVWGDVPVIYLMAERPSASRFIVTRLLERDWQGVGLRSAFLADLRRAPPRYVVMIHRSDDAVCTRPVKMREDTSANDGFPPDLLEMHYRLEKEFAGCALYVQIPAAPGPAAP